jgi:hypothetical protein
MRNWPSLYLTGARIIQAESHNSEKDGSAARLTSPSCEALADVKLPLSEMFRVSEVASSHKNANETKPTETLLAAAAFPRWPASQEQKA